MVAETRSARYSIDMNNNNGTQSLNLVSLGSVVHFRGTEYKVVKHNPKNTQIKRVSDGTICNLNGSAPVTVVTKATFEEGLDVRFAAAVVRIKEGDAVRVPNGKLKGNVGIVSRITTTRFEVAQLGGRGFWVTIHGELDVITKEEYIAAL